MLFWGGFFGLLFVYRRIFVVVQQDAVGGAIEVFELAALERPEKGHQANQAEEERDGNEIGQRAHDRLSGCFRFSRMALAVTTMEEDDMATAAISGVTMPATAIGTAIRL